MNTLSSSLQPKLCLCLIAITCHMRPAQSAVGSMDAIDRNFHYPFNSTTSGWHCIRLRPPHRLTSYHVVQLDHRVHCVYTQRGLLYRSGCQLTGHVKTFADLSARNRTLLFTGSSSALYSTISVLRTVEACSAILGLLMFSCISCTCPFF